MRYAVKKCKHPFYVNVGCGADIMLLKVTPIGSRGPSAALSFSPFCLTPFLSVFFFIWLNTSITVSSHHAFPKLSKKVRLNKKVKPLDPPKAELHLKDGERCQVAGWGISRSGGESVTQLRRADVRYLSLDKCRKTWGRLPDTVMCAGGFTKDGKGFCQVKNAADWVNVWQWHWIHQRWSSSQGDSGGPLLCKGVPVGIVSFNMKGHDKGGNCSYPNIPNVYTNLSKYTDWIVKTGKKTKC